MAAGDRCVVQRLNLDVSKTFSGLIPSKVIDSLLLHVQMKTIVVLLGIFSALYWNANGQPPSVKIGFADIDYIFSKLPESKQIQSELKSLQLQLENQLRAKYDEFRKKYEVFSSQSDSMDFTGYLNSQKELQLLQENLQKFEQECQASFDRKQGQLINPVLQKIHNAIRDVAYKQKYQLILSLTASSRNLVLHADDRSDISDIILQKLGVAPNVATKN